MERDTGRFVVPGRCRLSQGLGILGVLPANLPVSGLTCREQDLPSLIEVTRRWAALCPMGSPAEEEAAAGLALAQRWLVTLPEGPHADAAIEGLYVATKRACAALSGS